MIKKFQFLLIKSVTIIFLTLNANADYPNTSMAVIDLNYILSEADAAKDAAEQIEEIAISIENEIKKSDEDMVNEQNKLIESQAIMAPESFEKKREEYEKKVQNYNIERQQKLLSIDNLVNMSRGQVLEALKPILEEISNEKGITILLEKSTVLLNADGMDITEESLKRLNKYLSSIKISEE